MKSPVCSDLSRGLLGGGGGAWLQVELNHALATGLAQIAKLEISLKNAHLPLTLRFEFGRKLSQLSSVSLFL